MTRHFFRSRFRHVLQERQKMRRSFSVSKTISRVTPSGAPLSAFRRRFGSGDKAEDGKVKESLRA
jgi:hypothetical protein